MRVPKPAKTPEIAALEGFQTERLLVGDYRAAIGDRSAHSVEFTEKMLRSIFETTPGILSGINPDVLPQVRLAAALCFLWGRGTPYRRWLAKDVDTRMRLSGDVCVRMLLFSAYGTGHRTISPYERSATTDVGFELVCMLESCDACAKAAGTWISEFGIAELPNPHCTSLNGCRCTVRKRHRKRAEYYEFVLNGVPTDVPNPAGELDTIVAPLRCNGCTAEFSAVPGNGPGTFVVTDYEPVATCPNCRVTGVVRAVNTNPSAIARREAAIGAWRATIDSARKSTLAGS